MLLFLAHERSMTPTFVHRLQVRLGQKWMILISRQIRGHTGIENQNESLTIGDRGSADWIAI